MRTFTREEIYAMVNSIGLPCAYYEFQQATPQVPPFVVWFFATNNDVMADNENYVDKEILSIELYTKIRDFEQEKAVEAVLRANGFSYGKEPNYIDSEQIWQIAYESEVIIDEEEQG